MEIFGKRLWASECVREGRLSVQQTGRARFKCADHLPCVLQSGIFEDKEESLTTIFRLRAALYMASLI